MATTLRTPKAQIRSHTRDVLFGFILLSGVIIASVAVGKALGENEIANWGTWIGAFIAGIAMVATSYAIILQARQGEVAGWSVAVTRLGNLYDIAQQNEKLSGYLAEKSDEEGKISPFSNQEPITNQEIVWMGSLFLAFEQIYIATTALGYESKRVWRLYLKSQLNKPTLRAAFVRDAANSQDYHQDFWRFVRGSQKKHEGKVEYENYAIHPKYFESSIPSGTRSGDNIEMSCTSATLEDMSFWLEIYSDEEVRNQMYAAPLQSADELWSYLSNRKVFTAWVDGNRIGGFTITREKDLIATFGIAIHPDYRTRGWGKSLMRLLEIEASKMAVKTLRADVYEDNQPCIKMLKSDGFRRFIWMEKNI
jgi:ribosomal protein S18 acetylase RimI-like enzyme